MDAPKSKLELRISIPHELLQQKVDEIGQSRKDMRLNTQINSVQVSFGSLDSSRAIHVPSSTRQVRSTCRGETALQRGHQQQTFMVNVHGPLTMDHAVENDKNANPSPNIAMASASTRPKR